MKEVIYARYSLIISVARLKHKKLGAVVKFICSTFAAVIKTKVLKTAFTGTTPVLEFCKKHQKLA
jgi:hypothetical protein